MEKMSKWMSVLTTIGLSLLLLVLCYFLAGCAVVQPTFEGLPQVASEQEAMDWISRNVKYCLDKDQYGCKDYWATPEETMASLKGDCEDMAIMYLAICKQSLGAQGFLFVYTNRDMSSGHALGEVNGQRYYEVQSCQVFFRKYQYDDVLLMFGNRDYYNRGGNDERVIYTDAFDAAE